MKTKTMTAMALLAAAHLPATLPAQMELRVSGNYDVDTFRKAVPAIGSAAPDLVLHDLDGRPWSLGQQLGSFVVLVKGSFT